VSAFQTLQNMTQGCGDGTLYMLLALKQSERFRMTGAFTIRLMFTAEISLAILARDTDTSAWTRCLFAMPPHHA
jgi:hypothetical protein